MSRGLWRSANQLRLFRRTPRRLKFLAPVCPTLLSALAAASSVVRVSGIQLTELHEPPADFLFVSSLPASRFWPSFRTHCSLCSTIYVIFPATAYRLSYRARFVRAPRDIDRIIDNLLEISEPTFELDPNTATFFR